MRTTLTRPQGILFDLGGTLLRESYLDPRAGITRLLELAACPPACSPEVIQQAANELYVEIRSHHRSGLLEFPFRSFLRLLCDQFGIACDLQPADLEQEFWQAICSMVPEEGIDSVLRSLSDQGIALGVLSNSMFSAEVLRWELDRHRLAESFRFVMSSADYGLQKPHPVLFRVAVGKLGLRPDEVWFVGDNFEKDVVGARGAGLTAVWYNPQAVPCDGDPPVKVRTWMDFPELLESAHRSRSSP
jgi:HAD superfamily hydrolase (TIGR01509 family)